MSNVEIKDFNVLIDGKGFLDVPKHLKRLFTQVKIMITRLLIYWIMNIFQIIIN